MKIIGSIRKAVQSKTSTSTDLNASPNKSDKDDCPKKIVTDRPVLDGAHNRTTTLGSDDDVFENQNSQGLQEESAIEVSRNRKKSFNQSLSKYRAILPSKDSQSRKFIYHQRSPFTNAWLDLHDFSDLEMRPNELINTNDTSLKLQRTSQRNSFNPRNISNSSLLHSKLSICYDDEQMNEDITDSVKDTVVERNSCNITVDMNNDDLNSNENIISRTISISSNDSNDINNDGIVGNNERWIDNNDAKNSVITALTVFYALTMTIVALVLELSHLLSTETKRVIQLKDIIFGLYMYGMSVLFLFYCYLVLLLNPKWKNVIEKLKYLLKIGKIKSESTTELEENNSIAAATIHRKVTHDSPSAGSLFLRLGCILFGVIGTVYYAFDAFLSFTDNNIEKGNIALDICAIIFIFTQMHFLFCNWKMTIMGHHTVAKFGTMHLVAANLWTWIRYVLIEESVMDKEIREIFSPHEYVMDNINGSSNSMEFEHDEGSSEDHGDKLTPRIARSITRDCNSGADCILGSITDIMYTSIVEYSLIGAAVMFIVWRNIDHVRQTPTQYVKRKHQIRVDCSKTTSGLFCGLAFLAATFTLMAVFYGYSLNKRNHTAAFVFSITDIIQYIITSLACIYALWQMRLLRYHHSTTPKLNVNPSQELLDMILLSLGMIGEMIYSVAGLVGLTGDNIWQSLSVVLLVCHITRLLQVGLQSCLIYIAGKLRIQGNFQLRERQPGKQVITFLLIANIAMFFMNLLETEKAGISETVVNFYGKKSWVFLVRSFSPLTIFYRFHSSVCFAEVWKNVYAWKN